MIKPALVLTHSFVLLFTWLSKGMDKAFSESPYIRYSHTSKLHRWIIHFWKSATFALYILSSQPSKSMETSQLVETVKTYTGVSLPDICSSLCILADWGLIVPINIDRGKQVMYLTDLGDSVKRELLEQAKQDRII